MSLDPVSALVDASAEELGSSAEASAVRALALEAMNDWPAQGSPQSVIGAELLIDAGIPFSSSGTDAVASLWTRVSAALSGIPFTVPTVPHLTGVAAVAGLLERTEIPALFNALNQLACHSGVPTLRLEWCDLLAPSRGDMMILDLLEDLLPNFRLLCGHIRVASPDGRVYPDTSDLLRRVAASKHVKASNPIGLATTPDRDAQVETARIRPIVSSDTPSARVAARAWAQVSAERASQRSGLAFESAHPGRAFDAPPPPGSALRPPDSVPPAGVPPITSSAPKGRTPVIWIP